MKITLVTGNWAKIAQAKEILEPLGIEVDSLRMETIEIQADTVEEVAAYSAKWASDKLNTAVVKNDTGLFVEALDGFPGAYTHFASDTIGERGLLKLMKGIENRKAKFVQAVAFCEPGKESIVFSSTTEGTLAKRRSGKYGWTWDFIFIPKGQTKTLANFPDQKRFKLWADTCYLQLADYLKKNKYLK